MNEKTVGTVCFYLGFVSIAASIAIWFPAREQTQPTVNDSESL
jgi:hypothetical protein